MYKKIGKKPYDCKCPALSLSAIYIISMHERVRVRYKKNFFLCGGKEKKKGTNKSVEIYWKTSCRVILRSLLTFGNPL